RVVPSARGPAWSAQTTAMAGHAELRSASDPARLTHLPRDLQFWTDFADGAVMFPLGIAVALTLFALHQRRAATAWTLSIGCVWAAMLALKLAGYTIDALMPASPLNVVDLVTPSGHVASASAIYGGVIGLVLRWPGTLKVRMLTASAAVAIGIGLTRIALGEHSLSEVLIGAAVGLGGAVGLASMAGASVDRRAALALTAVTILVMAVQHGEHLSWEQGIHRFALEAIGRWRGTV
ncbi:MAG: phosphatase PAP2 family protein, partial [Pseudomonadota bacterium]|nr:phosphatase PAP2 family protein [Pseudomonadota bacterium]